MTVPVTYTCPYCDRVHTLDRPPVLADQSVTKTPVADGVYAAVTDADREQADGIAFVCGVDDREPDGGGCGRQFYLNFVAEATPAGGSLEDPPRFDFRR